MKDFLKRLAPWLGMALLITVSTTVGVFAASTIRNVIIVSSTFTGDTITGGTIDNTVIGGSTPANGSFSNLFLTTIGSSPAPLCTTSGGQVTNSGCTGLHVIQAATLANEASTTCPSSSTAYNTCTYTLNWPSSFASTPSAVCMSGTTSALALTQLELSSISTTQIVVIVQNGDASGANGITLNGLTCLGVV